MKRWPTKPLGDVAQVTAGNPAPQRPEDFAEDGVPFVRMQDVGRLGQSTCLAETKDRLSPSASVRLKRFPVGSILVPKSGASIRLNHRAILGIEAHVVSHLAVIVPRPLLNTRFAYYWLCGIDLSGVAHQADLPSMKTSELARLQLPVPPLAEQERLVKLLDEADELRKLRVQADSCTGALIPALFHEMFGDPFTSPKSWSVVRIDEAGKVQLGRQRAPKYQTGKFTRPYVRVANVYEDEIDVGDLLSMDFDKRDFAQYRLEEGDILLNEGQSTELVGRPAMWRNEIADCCFQNTLVRFQPDRKRVLPDFALAVFLAYFRGGNFANISSKTSNVAHLGAARFAKMPFPLPPLPQQKEFASRVSEIRTVQAEQATSRRRLDDLFQSMLHRAFRGEL
ncbi:MAG: restriction endonuclease subunit S [Nitrospirae bacterium]|nr:restriction endonuclease subunit S [Nitrospirota bacterium]